MSLIEILGEVELENSEPGYLKGVMEMEAFGTYFHVEAIRVIDDEDGCQGAWHPESGEHDNANDVRLSDLFEYAQCEFETIQIPGFEGEYVLVITPFGK